MKKLTDKIFINGNIIAKTGLRIGGNKSSLEIGGVDLSVIKTGNGKPYIPGSSLKGKMRSLLCKIRGSEDVKHDDQDIKSLFGDAGGKDERGITRLVVRDLALDTEQFNLTFGPKEDRLLDYEFTEIKTENRIERSVGTAKDPRQVERIPADTQFKMELVLDVYEEDDETHYLKLIGESLQLLEMDYLGGHGSRGSGRVEIEIKEIFGKTFSTEGIKDRTDETWKDYFTS